VILWPEYYGLAPDHCISVLNGEYDIPYEGEPVILDIGANVGAFARWAKGRWPNSTIHSYEPHPKNHELLCKTVVNFGLKDVSVYNLAVADREGEFELHHNGFNCGEWSLAVNAATHGEPIKVQCVDAATLPEADIIKVDTEGAEPIILARLARCGKLQRTSAIMLEYHSSSVVQLLIDGLAHSGFKKIAQQEFAEHRGILKFMR
jgi:FkbM family methyltransferase